jgi:hypothetical protein
MKNKHQSKKMNTKPQKYSYSNNRIIKQIVASTIFGTNLQQKKGQPHDQHHPLLKTE